MRIEKGMSIYEHRMLTNDFDDNFDDEVMADLTLITCTDTTEGLMETQKKDRCRKFSK